MDKRCLRLWVEEETVDTLRCVARQLGYEVKGGPFKGRGSISSLLIDLVEGNVEARETEDPLFRHSVGECGCG